MYKARFFSH